MSKQATILIIDDLPTNLGLLFNALRQVPYRVLVHTSGQAALNAIHEASPDLILLDVMMPGMDGFETCRRLKADPKVADIPVLFLTALSDATDELRGFEVGGVDYIIKPIKVPTVLARVQTHLKLRALQQAMAIRNAELEAALKQVRQLEGLVPICANCKKIRDDAGYWHEVEVYVEAHSEAQFTHGICPDCKTKLYPQLSKAKNAVPQPTP